MSTNIKRAGIEDAAGIAKIHVETWRSHYRGQISDDYLNNISVEKRTIDWIKTLSKIEKDDATFIFKEEGKIFGFCRVGHSRDADIEKSRDRGELYAIYVYPSKQNQGIGSALLLTGLNFLHKNHFKTVTLWVLKSNLSAINFLNQKDGNLMEDKKWKIVMVFYLKK
jgi:ribosomal protein S18 acetylase RimI-like enzyme